VRKSLKSELEISNGSIEDFYKLYSKNMRDLGTPTHSKEFFDHVISEFGEKANILVVVYKSEPVAAAILLCFKDTMISGWAASDKKHRNLNPNNLLYWSAIKLACEEGYTVFDFGKSIKDSGTYKFKKPWGAEPCQLYYSYYLKSPRKNIPDTSTLNAKRQVFSKIYRGIPLTMANFIGPMLRRNFS